MPLTPIQLNDIKRKLREQGMSEDKIKLSVQKVQEQYEERYGSQPLDTGGYSAPQTTQRTQNQSVSSFSQPRSIPSQPPRQQNMGSRPQEESNPISKFFQSLYSTNQDPTMVEKQQNLSGFRGAAQKVADAAPFVAGTVAGVAGSAVGASAGGVGALPGGAAGTLVGVAVGKAFENAIEDLIGTQDQTPIDQVKEQVVDAGTAAAFDFATGKILSKVAPYAKGALKSVGKFVSGKGDDLALRAIRPSPSQQRKFFQKTGMELKEFTIKNGLFQEGVEQVDELIDPLQQSFDDIAKSQDIQVPVSTVKDKFDDAIKFLNDQPTEQAKSLAKQLKANRDLFLDKVGNKKSVSAEFITKIRKNVDKVIPDSQFLKDPVAAAVNTQTRRAYQSALQDAAGDMAVNGRNLKEMGQELRNLYAFREIAASQQYLGKGTLPVGLIKSIMFTGGAGAYGATQGDSTLERLGNGVAYAAGASALNNPRVVNFLTRQLMKNGDLLAQLPDKQLAKMGTEIIRRSLSNLMALQLNNLGGESSDFNGQVNAQDNNGESQESQGNLNVAQVPNQHGGDQNAQQNTPNIDQNISSNDVRNGLAVDRLDSLSVQATPPSNIDGNIPQKQPIVNKPFNGMSKYELVQLAVAQGFSGSQLDEIRNTYDSIMADYEEAIGQSGDVDSLLKRRSDLKAAGYSTRQVDDQLASMGYTLSDQTQDQDLTEGQETKRDLAASGLRALDTIEELLEKDPGRVLKASLPGQLGARDYDSAAFKAVEALLRSRSGAAVPETEVRRYMRANLPRVGDSQATVDQKLESFRKDLMDQYNVGSSDYDPAQDQKKKIDNQQSDANLFLEGIVNDLKNFDITPQAYAADVLTKDSDGFEPVEEKIDDKKSRIRIPGIGFIEVLTSQVKKTRQAIDKFLKNPNTPPAPYSGPTYADIPDQPINPTAPPKKQGEVAGATDTQNVDFNFKNDPKINIGKAPKGAYKGKEFPLSQPEGKAKEVILDYFSDIPAIAAAIANTESGYNWQSVNEGNSDGSVDVGLFQINENTYKDYVRRAVPGTMLRKRMEQLGIPIQEMDTETFKETFKNPDVNGAMARLIYEFQGTGAWFGPRDNGIRFND